MDIKRISLPLNNALELCVDLTQMDGQTRYTVSDPDKPGWVFILMGYGAEQCMES